MALRVPTSAASLSWGGILLDTPTALTWMAWIKHPNNFTNDVNTFFHKGTNAYYFTSSGNPNCPAAGVFGASERRVNATNVIPVNVDVHVAWTYTSTGPVSVFFKNGVVQTMTGSEPTWGDQAANALEFLNNAASTYDLSHFKWFSAVLTEAEIFREMQTRRPQRTANLEIWCPFDDGATPKDYSGNGRHPTNTNCTVVDGPPVNFGAAVMVL